MKAINKPYKTVVKNAQGSIYVPKKMRDGYVFVGRSCGDAEAALGEGGMICWGNPKYSFWVEGGKFASKWLRVHGERHDVVYS